MGNKILKGKQDAHGVTILKSNAGYAKITCPRCSGHAMLVPNTGKGVRRYRCAGRCGTEFSTNSM
jgi:DNA-directed RNA polymerase subunit RPC12/RpoP